MCQADILRVFLLAIGMNLGRVQAEGPAFKAVHLLNIPSGAAEAALLGALDELNQAIAKEGSSQAYQRAMERVRSVVEGSIKDHVYNQYAEVAAAKATK